MDAPALLVQNVHLLTVKRASANLRVFKYYHLGTIRTDVIVPTTPNVNPIFVLPTVSVNHPALRY